MKRNKIIILILLFLLIILDGIIYEGKTIIKITDQLSINILDISKLKNMITTIIFFILSHIYFFYFYYLFKKISDYNRIHAIIIFVIGSSSCLFENFIKAFFMNSLINLNNLNSIVIGNFFKLSLIIGQFFNWSLIIISIFIIYNCVKNRKYIPLSIAIFNPLTIYIIIGLLYYFSKINILANMAGNISYFIFFIILIFVDNNKLEKVYKKKSNIN